MDKTLKEILDALDQKWDDARIKTDWLAYERLMVRILEPNGLDDDLKCKLARECLDAFTKRGHFVSYANGYIPRP